MWPNCMRLKYVTDEFGQCIWPMYVTSKCGNVCGSGQAQMYVADVCDPNVCGPKRLMYVTPVCPMYVADVFG